MGNSLFVRFKEYIKQTSIRQKLLYALLSAVSLPLLVSGVFALSYLFYSSERSLRSATDDKLHITRLIFENTRSALANTSRAIAEDNLVIINLELLLLPPIDAYLENAPKKGHFDFAVLLDGKGKLVAGIDTLRHDAPQNALFLPDVLNRVVEHNGMAFTTSATPFGYDAKALTLVSVSPIYNAAKRLLGFVCTGMILGSQAGEGTRATLSELRNQLGIPWLIADSKTVFWYSEGTNDFPPPAQDFLSHLDSNQETDFIDTHVGPDGFLVRFLPLRDDAGLVVAGIGVAYPQVEVLQARNLAVFGVLFVLGISFVLAALSATVAIWLARMILRPIAAVAAGVKSIVQGNFDVKIQVANKDEIGIMAQEFTAMALQLKTMVNALNKEIEERREAENQVRLLNDGLEQRVDERTRDLTNANEALAESLSMLRKTQNHLIESEKLTALGNLVAGMFHEINTPIGTALTAITFLGTKLDELEKRLIENMLSRSDMDAFRENARQVVILVDNNLSRAVEQVRFFKQITIDDEKGKPRAFELNKYMRELLISLGPQIKSFSERIEIQIPLDLLIKASPSALYQITTNLIMNSILHGFPAQREGIIRIAAEEKLGAVEISISDNGIGIPSGVLPHIFEPFFTTRQGTGRTGLGLSIVHHLVNNQLKGAIRCDSQPGKGTAFIISIPTSTGYL